jgi:hypothetical protein
MNYIMLDGKKSVAERIVYGALEMIEDKAQARSVSASSTMRWKMFRLTSRCAPAVLVVRPIRSRLKFVPSAARRWPSAGWWLLRVAAMKTPCASGSRLS